MRLMRLRVRVSQASTFVFELRTMVGEERGAKGAAVSGSRSAGILDMCGGCVKGREHVRWGRPYRGGGGRRQLYRGFLFLVSRIKTWEGKKTRDVNRWGGNNIYDVCVAVRDISFFGGWVGGWESVGWV